MWFKNIFNRKAAAAAQPLFDEAFLRRVERLALHAPARLRGHPSGGEHLSRNQLPATIFSGHRPYSAGDDYRYVDWNAYAHQEEVFIKLGEVEQSVNVHLLLDSSRSMGWGAPPKIRLAQQLVAAIGYLALAQHDRLHVATIGETALDHFGPAQGKGRLPELLSFIEAARTDHQTALEQAIGSYAREHPRGGLLVLCSDLLVPGRLDGMLRTIAPPRWKTIVLHLLDPRELQPELSGPIELEDAETGQRLPITLDAAALADYRRNVNAWQERIASTCARRGASYAQVLTSWPLERQVLPYLRARQIIQ